MDPLHEASPHLTMPATSHLQGTDAAQKLSSLVSSSKSDQDKKNRSEISPLTMSKDSRKRAEIIPEAHLQLLLASIDPKIQE